MGVDGVDKVDIGGRESSIVKRELSGVEGEARCGLRRMCGLFMPRRGIIS